MSKTFAEWSTAEVNDLPDSSFAYVEDGEKDSDGKTTPRSKRHLPYKDKDGKVDLPHTRNALARLNQTEAVPAGERDAIKKKLESALEKAKASTLHAGIFPFEFTAPTGSAQLPTEVHLIPIGQWEHDLYGTITVNASDVQEFIRNFDAKLRKGIFITAGHEGSAELPAQGWITRVFARDNGLWGDVEWTKLGEQTLSDKQYKFFSPEFYPSYEDPETHQQYRNVLTGGALTKSPYFKELEAVVFSDKNLESKFKDNQPTMNIKDILKKKAADRSAEEKKFLEDHKAEMSDAEKAQCSEEETAAIQASEKAKGDANEAKGLNRDGSAKIVADDKGMVKVSAAEFAALTEKANKGAEAATKLEASELSAGVTKLIFTEANKDGRFLPKSEEAVKTFMQTLNADQRKAFADLIGQLPEHKLFTEVGDAGAGNGAGAAAKEVDTKTTAIMAADKTVKYGEALKRVFASETGLEKRYRDELLATQG